MCFSTHSGFFLREGNVGTNFIFWDPCLVMSSCFLAKLPIAFGTVEEDAPLELAPFEPDGGWDIVSGERVGY